MNTYMWEVKTTLKKPRLYRWQRMYYALSHISYYHTTQIAMTDLFNNWSRM